MSEHILPSITPDPDYFDPKVLRDQFTDRDKEILAFETKLSLPTPLPVLMYYGVGGTGKTFLLRYLLYKFGYLWRDDPIGYPHAYLNFRPGHTPLNGPDALFQARRQFRKHLAGVAFTRFDFLWGIWWERVHGMAITHNKDLLPEEISSIAELLQTAAWLPLVGDVFKGVNLVGNITSKVKERIVQQTIQQWFEERIKPSNDINWKAALELLNLEDLNQLLAMAFGSDLADASKELTPPRDRILLFLDTYETLQEHLRDQTSFVQIMAQELILQEANVLVVIAGRDILHWAEVRNRSGTWVSRDPRTSIWAQTIHRSHQDLTHDRYLEQHLVGELSEADAADYLFKRNISDPDLVNRIVRFTAGYPLALGVAADLLAETTNTEKKDIGDLSDRTFSYPPLSKEWREEIIDWLVAKLFEQLQHANKKELMALTKAAAVPRWFNPALLFRLVGDYAVEEKFEELASYSFIESYQVEKFQAFRLHSIMRDLLLQQIAEQERTAIWNRAALKWFEQQVQISSGSLRWRYELELLYHNYQENPDEALSLFQSMAERLVRLQQVDMLDGLLSDFRSYMPEGENSVVSNWCRYYDVRLIELRRQLTKAKDLYAEIGNNSENDRKLRSYALCDWANLLVRMENLSQEGGIQKALDAINRCFELGQPMDSKLIFLYASRRSIHNYKCEWDEAIAALQTQTSWLESHGDVHGLLRTMHELRGIYAMQGNWKEAEAIHRQIMDEAAKLPENTFLQARLRWGLNWSLIWSGCCHQAELESRTGLAYARELNNVNMIAQFLREIAHAVASQGRFTESAEIFEQSEKLYAELGEAYEGSWASTLGFKGLLCLQAGDLDTAKRALESSLQMKQHLGDNMGIPELLLWLGQRSECAGDWEKAAGYYKKYLEDYLWTGRRHFECQVYCGLLRVHYEQHNYAAIPPLLTKTKELIQEYGYRDHAANLRLLQGHMAWDGHFNDVDSFADALLHYQAALFYSLCFNRFLLDSLVGESGATLPLKSIITACRQRGDEGKRMLVALKEWWANDEIDTMLNQLSIPGIEGKCSLLAFEKDQRLLEPADGKKQMTFIERIATELRNY